MSTLTREVLIRTIVANEMKEHDGSDYTQKLKIRITNGNINQVMLSVKNLIK